MQPFSSAIEWLVGMPSNLPRARQSEYVAQGLALAERQGTDEDVATLRIHFANKLLLDDRPMEALEVLRATEIPKDLIRDGLPRFLAEAFHHAGDSHKALDTIFLGFDVTRISLSPSEHEEYKRRRMAAICIAARVSVDRLREQIEGFTEDIESGYVFCPERYPIDQADLLQACEGLRLRETVLSLLLPYDHD